MFSTPGFLHIRIGVGHSPIHAYISCMYTMYTQSIDVTYSAATIHGAMFNQVNMVINFLFSQNS